MRNLHAATFQDFLRQRSALQRQVSIKLAFIDLCAGDHMAALMLSLVVDQVARPGSSDHPDGWVRMPWVFTWGRARMTRKKGRQLLNRLVRLGYCQTKVMRFQGAPTLHVRLCEQAFMAAWRGVLNGQAPMYLDDADVSGQ